MNNNIEIPKNLILKCHGSRNITKTRVKLINKYINYITYSEYGFNMKSNIARYLQDILEHNKEKINNILIKKKKNLLLKQKKGFKVKQK